MDNKNNIEKKLLHSFSQFKRLHWNHKMSNKSNHSKIVFLSCLKNHEKEKGLRVSEISQLLHITAPTVTQLVNSLEKEDYVVRKIDECDRRAVRIKISEKGEELLQEKMKCLLIRFKGLVDYLGEEKSDELADLMMEVVAYFNQLNEKNDNSSKKMGDGSLC